MGSDVDSNYSSDDEAVPVFSLEVEAAAHSARSISLRVA